jgi:hypothetical protein
MKFSKGIASLVSALFTKVGISRDPFVFSGQLAVAAATCFSVAMVFFFDFGLHS